MLDNLSLSPLCAKILWPIISCLTAFNKHYLFIIKSKIPLIVPTGFEMYATGLPTCSMQKASLLTKPICI